MRNELIEIERIDNYLLKKSGPAEMKLFEMDLLLDSSLFEKTEKQKLVHRFVRIFHRRLRRKKLENLHHYLMRQPDFKKTIDLIFT